MKNKPVSLSVVYVAFLLFTSLLAIIALSALIMYYSNKVVEKNTRSFRKTYIESKKKEVKDNVLTTIRSIVIYREKEKTRIANNLKSVLERIYTVYLKLLKYSGMQDRDSIESFLEYAFSHGGGYYVAFLESYESLRRLLEETGRIENLHKNNLYGFKFLQSIPVEIKGKLKYWDEIEGFLLCSKVVNRCIFVFESQDRIEKEIKRKILFHIVHFNMTPNENKYVFINKTDGEALILNNKIIDNGTKLWQIRKNTSNKVREVFKKELKAYNKGGGFITYTWYEPKIGKITKKTSYIGCYKPWRWIVGEGFYHDNVETMITNINGKIHHSIGVVISIFYILIAVVFIMVIFVFLGFSKILDYRKEKIMRQLKSSLDRNRKMDLGRYKLKEIREFAENINRAIDIFQQYEEEFIVALVNAVEMRDTYTQGHSQRVAYYSKVIAEALGFDEEKQEEIYRAGLLHDIGKIGIPDIILLKPDKLTTYEYEIIKYHSVFSFDIVSKIARFEKMANYIRHHHERCDGSGYPDGLKCNEIEIEAKIIAIADVFDALTSKRVYREQLEPEEALKIIEKDKLDQNIVEKVKDKLIEAFLWEEDNEERPYTSKVNKIRRELFEVDFKTGLKRRRVIINKATKLMLDKKPFLIALLKINNFDALLKSSFKEMDSIISNLSEFLREALIKEGINTEFVSHAFDDAFLMLVEVESAEDLEKIKKTFDRLPKELTEKIDVELNLSINHKVFPQEFDSDLDSILIRLRLGSNKSV